MTSAPTNNAPFKVAENITFSKEPSQFLLQLTDVYKKIAFASNSKDIGTYLTIELLNGQEYFGANPQTRNPIYRKVLECGALKNAGTTTAAHGISGITDAWMFTRVYGMARKPGAAPSWIPLPNGATRDCGIEVDSTNVYITSSVDLSAFTYSIVILEY